MDIEWTWNDAVNKIITNLSKNLNLKIKRIPKTFSPFFGVVNFVSRTNKSHETPRSLTVRDPSIAIFNHIFR